jgi:hypothetical protein
MCGTFFATYFINSVPDNGVVYASQAPMNYSQSAGRGAVGGCEGMPVELHHWVLHLQIELEIGQTASGAVTL